MSYATIMVHLDLARSNASLLAFTADLANRMQAGVIGIVACQPLAIVTGDGMIMGDYVQQDRNEINAEIDTARAEFYDYMTSRVSDLQWRSTTTIGPLCDFAAEQARSADLILVSVGAGVAPTSSRRFATSDLVMCAGRPILLVPDGVDALGTDCMMVAWKDTREARRAVADALPLLKLAAEVIVVEIATSDEFSDAEARCNDLVAWLHRHRVKAAAMPMLSSSNDSATLRSFVEDQHADLIIAGGYGHSRLREWVLGGVTRDFLLHTDRCLLISH